MKQIFPTGSSSAPSVPVPCKNCIALSSSQFLTGTVPFHQTPLSKTFGVLMSSHPFGIAYRYSFRLVKESPSGSPTEPFIAVGDNGSKPYCHSHPSGRPSLSLSQSWGCVLIMNSKPYVNPSPSSSVEARASQLPNSIAEYDANNIIEVNKIAERRLRRRILSVKLTETTRKPLLSNISGV